ncbi:extracellular catalytic domain type 1 short-chain-length polyhydroxyalkanoate depolymerase [Steroidobacter agaridevorans]|uniref:extracellular catalytic domain type 1 short-chain-length polyhydroxyalkanoate depolymerase n=1 Tax=Steroidobacter agaridevorans TaxID=2695856 RepID=UPI001379899E|nr:PHB depolymerase family esterase [Steroidobacter agaridevorans]
MTNIQSITVRRLARTAAAIILLGSQILTVAQASAGPGRVDRYPFHDPAPNPTNPPPGSYSYQVYVPAHHNTASSWPLFVMVHGCGTTADEQMYANGINDIADQESFLVMYPDNGGNCWRAVTQEASSIERGGGGDADLIAEMTQETMANYNIDPERVYIIGMSSGAFQTTANAAAYPDIYAAAGVMAGGGYGMDFVGCMLIPDLAAPLYSMRAINQMGVRARVIPFISLGGTSDPLGETPILGCTRKAFIEAMATNNLLNGNRYTLDPSSSVNGQVPGGYSWSKQVWRDTSGCRIGERWVINGMGHFWSGGSSDPQWAEWTDPKGPNAGRAAWDFFSRYRKSDTGGNCTESSQ